MDTGVIEQLRSKTALVTGGTDGIGKEVARGLAQRGARLIIVGRDAEKGARAERDIRASTKNSDVDFVQADLSLVREARRIGDEVARRWSTIHYLVHSAGIVRGRRVLTAEGFESNFATNYLSRFALTVRLLPSLRAAGHRGKSARIVVVAAPGSNGTIHYDDVNLTKNFSTVRALMQYQHANDVFVVELARRLAVSGERPSVAISCLHPGVVTRTNIRKEFPLWMKLMVRLVADPLFSHAPDVPAAAALRLLLAEEFESESGVLFSLLRKFKRLSPPLNAEDPREGHRLWAFSEEVIGEVLGQQTALASPAIRPAT
ncbi:MAG TPA: SDR family NAD(P)-dependent oxidoreductase [Xanthobacteraceae bacterium]